MSIKIRTQRLAVKCDVPAILPLQEINVKHLIAAVMLLSTTANADDLQLIAEAHQPANIAATVARIAQNTLTSPYIPVESEGGIFGFHDAENYDDTGLLRLKIDERRPMTNRLITAQVTTHFREFSQPDPLRDYGERGICDYPAGGLTVEYDALDPLNFRVTGVSGAAVYSCDSVSWHHGYDGKNFDYSRRWDSLAAWKNHWKAANRAVIDVLGQASCILDWFLNTPLFSIPFILLSWFIGWRAYKKRQSKNAGK